MSASVSEKKEFYSALNTPDSKSFNLSLFARTRTELSTGPLDEGWEHFLIIYERRVIASTSQYLDETGSTTQRSFDAENFGQNRERRRNGYFWYKDLATAARAYQIARKVAHGAHVTESDTIVLLDARQYAMLTQHPDWQELEGVTLTPAPQGRVTMNSTRYHIVRQ